MPLAYLGLGSNLGESALRLRAARDAIAAWPQTTLLATSPLYLSEPVGGPAGQPTYLNAVVALATTLAPLALLRLGLELEAAQGRTRRQPDGPRTLDIDLLLYGEWRCATPELVLPHPRMSTRRFVLAPLCDLAPRLRLPGTGQTIAELLAALPPTPRVERLPEDW